ncbi:MAG: LytR/AlgR family response regulator transcription factor [Janthinobacterium lividum]
MKQLTCIAIDDEPLALNLIESYVAKLPSLKLLKTFEDALYASEFLQNNQVDLLFVDINMPDINGIKLVRSLTIKPMVIFTTAYKNFAFEGFELQALDYLLKPIDFPRFSKAVEKAVDFYQYKTAASRQPDAESLYVYSEYRMIKIEVSNIEYIESMEDYIKIHLLDQPKPILTLMALKKVLEKLPEDRFKRIHRSYVVALQQIKSIHNKKVQLKSVELPVSNSYYDLISKWSQ